MQFVITTVYKMLTHIGRVPRRRWVATEALAEGACVVGGIATAESHILDAQLHTILPEGDYVVTSASGAVQVGREELLSCKQKRHREIGTFLINKIFRDTNNYEISNK